jgi:DNA-binding XRE family transcriptional regulator
MAKKQTIGQDIKALRLRKQWTQERMANWLDISKATLVRLEHGAGCMELTRAKIVQRLAEAQVAA